MGWITKENYLLYAGVVGSLASVVGLIALAKPAISQDDIKTIELNTLRSIADTTEQLKILEYDRLKTKDQLVSLEQQKKEMELLVKKASLALFLKEQYSYLEESIINEVNQNQPLKVNLDKLIEVSNKLQALNEEIDASPQADKLKEIIHSANKKSDSLTDIVADLVEDNYLIFPFGISKAFSRVLRINKT